MIMTLAIIKYIKSKKFGKNKIWIICVGLISNLLKVIREERGREQIKVNFVIIMLFKKYCKIKILMQEVKICNLTS